MLLEGISPNFRSKKFIDITKCADGTGAALPDQLDGWAAGHPPTD